MKTSEAASEGSIEDAFEGSDEAAFEVQLAVEMTQQQFHVQSR